MEELIVTYLISKGGIWGVLLSIALLWILYREKFLSFGKDKKDDEPEPDSPGITKIGENTQDIKEKVDKLILAIDSLKDINEIDRQKIDQLTIQLQQVNDERIDELKELLNGYSKTMNDLTLTLEKIKFVLKTKLNGD